MQVCAYYVNGTANELFAKKSTIADEIGLGVVTDPTGNFEIYLGGFLQIDISNVPISGSALKMTSSTGPDTYIVYGSNYKQ